MSTIEPVFPNDTSRRQFISRITQAGLGAAAMTYLAGCAGQEERATELEQHIPRPDVLPGIPGSNTDQAVLNFALTLEIMEADLYRQALNKACGRPSNAPLETGGNYPQTVSNGNLDDQHAAAGFGYLHTFAAVEAAHRDFLTAAIRGQKGQPVEPNAGGYRFPQPLGDDLASILNSLADVEAVGVRAYLGAAPLIDNFDLLTAAASIYSTEASHSAAIRTVLGMNPGPVRMPGDHQVTPNQASESEMEYYLDPRQVLDIVKPYFVS